MIATKLGGTEVLKAIVERSERQHGLRSTRTPGSFWLVRLVANENGAGASLVYVEPSESGEVSLLQKDGFVPVFFQEGRDETLRLDRQEAEEAAHLALSTEGLPASVDVLASAYLDTTRRDRRIYERITEAFPEYVDCTVEDAVDGLLQRVKK